ncbi:MAG: hypothetical protein CBC24_01840 [Candidatus Pelagibacter sp. TMED64]|nr:hypothetical protein [Candidatus Pelagibacter sp.]OUU67060.1 MAG: hypothetical protein CBC24_01840 [Candidatus Pelagibacter sp. TMED64]|tara:strand:+ start:1834 stop:2022 length:189 start_codon:yes stop_codon:yes gene_type:complete
MFSKFEILLILLSLILVFYFVITLGAKRKNKEPSKEIKGYLLNVNILLVVVAIVGTVLWLFI